MEIKPLLQKGLAVGIILLFVGGSCISAINAQFEKMSSKNNMIHKFIRETLDLSAYDLTEIESYLSDIEVKFQDAITTKDKLAIINETAILCSEQGFLPDEMSIEQIKHFMIIQYVREEQHNNHGFFPQRRYSTTDRRIFSIEKFRNKGFSVDTTIKNLESRFEKTLMTMGNHPPINIYGNENFTAEHGVVGGSGTLGDPYIIANWIITDNGIANSGIVIYNTDAYFIIRNCTASGFVNKSWFSGIKFINVTHGKIEGSEVYTNSQGIYIYQSTNIEIVNCISYQNLEGYGMGIISEDSSYITIKSCNCYSNGYGIHLWYSSYCTIENTSCYNQYDIGVFILTDSLEHPIEYDIIKNCKIYNNVWGGIIMVVLIPTEKHPGYNRIVGCEIYDNGHVLDIDNAMEGIGIGSLNNNIIENCDIHHNGLAVLLDCSNNIIRNCSIHDQWEPAFASQGIQIAGSFSPYIDIVRNNSIEHCNIYNQDIGIAIYDALRTYIQKNNIFNNRFVGIELVAFQFIHGLTTTWIKGNNICENGYINGVIYASGLYTEGLGYADARYNWWNSTLGPSKVFPKLRGDCIYNFGRLTLNRFRPWSLEMFPDAGLQIPKIV